MTKEERPTQRKGQHDANANSNAGCEQFSKAEGKPATPPTTNQPTTTLYQPTTTSTKTASKIINNLKAALTSIDNSLTKRPQHAGEGNSIAKLQ